MMIATLVILGLTALMFVIGKIRSDIVALCALLALLLLGILTPQEALSGFSSPVVIMMVGLFVVGGAVLRTGLARIASNQVMRLAGNSPTALFLLVVLTAAFIGAFVSNTGTVALMLPIVVSMAAQSGTNASRLLMPLAFASSMGGMLTLIGTPPNLVIQEALVEGGYDQLGFFSFTPVGIVCLAVGILVMMPLSKWVLDRKVSGNKKGEKKSLSQLADEYTLNQCVYRCHVADGSPIVGKSMVELDLRNTYNINVVEVRQEAGSRSKLMHNVTQHIPGPGTQVQAGDILYLNGEKDDIRRFAADYGLSNLAGEKLSSSQLDFYDIGIAELVLLPDSRLVNREIRRSGFREKFNVNVLGIRRRGTTIVSNLAEERFRPDDLILVQGSWKNIGRLEEEEEDWVVLGKPQHEAESVTRDYKAPYAAFVMLLMVFMMVFDFIPVAPVTAVMLAAVLMVLGGCFKNVEAAYKTINWESVVLIAAMMPMSVALEKTGASEMISHSLVGALGDMGPTVLLAGIYFTTSLLTMFISNTATAVLMSPIALASAEQVGCSPYPFLFAVAVSASMCFASPFSTPPNALVMQPGNYRFIDYIKFGLPLQLIMGIVMVLLLPLIV